MVLLVIIMAWTFCGVWSWILLYQNDSTWNEIKKTLLSSLRYNMDAIYLTYRNAVVDPSHYNSELWNKDTIALIQTETSRLLKERHNMKMTIPIEQIRNVMDSFSNANARIGSKESIQTVIEYIVHQVELEERPTPAYDSRVINYDGSFGIQRMSQGQLGIKKKGLNRIGRMF